MEYSNESILKLTDTKFKEYYQDLKFKQFIAKGLEKNCKDSDLSSFQYSKKNNNEQINYDLKIQEIYNNNLDCLKVLEKIKNNTSNDIKFDVFASKAYDITTKKIKLDNLMIDAVNLLKKDKNNDKIISEKIGMYSMGAKMAKKEEISVWKELNQNFNNSKTLQKAPSYGFFSFLIILTITAIYLKRKKTSQDNNSTNNNDQDSVS